MDKPRGDVKLCSQTMETMETMETTRLGVPGP